MSSDLVPARVPLVDQLSVETEDGPWRYRFWLSRFVGPTWAPNTDAADGAAKRWCVFVMLNPSTADATNDDPTIRRCMSFARREGCWNLGVVNLFAARATKPKRLVDCPDLKSEANVPAVRMAVQTADVLVAAWGAHDMALPWQVRAHRAPIEGIARMSAQPLFCLGMTKGGAPRHPLYVRGDQPLVEYQGVQS